MGDAETPRRLGQGEDQSCSKEWRPSAMRIKGEGKAMPKRERKRGKTPEGEPGNVEVSQGKRQITDQPVGKKNTSTARPLHGEEEKRGEENGKKGRGDHELVEKATKI